MGWIEEALLQGQLKITENNNCPFCNPERRTDVPTKVNACKVHKWVSKNWYTGMKNTFESLKREG